MDLFNEIDVILIRIHYLCRVDIAVKMKLRVLVDHTSIEIFGNDGEVVVTSNFMPALDNVSYLFSADKKVKIISADIYSLKSIWPKG